MNLQEWPTSLLNPTKFSLLQKSHGFITFLRCWEKTGPHLPQYNTQFECDIVTLAALLLLCTEEGWPRVSVEQAACARECFLWNYCAWGSPGRSCYGFSLFLANLWGRKWDRHGGISLPFLWTNNHISNFLQSMKDKKIIWLKKVSYNKDKFCTHLSHSSSSRYRYCVCMPLRKDMFHSVIHICVNWRQAHKIPV